MKEGLSEKRKGHPLSTGIKLDGETLEDWLLTVGVVKK